MTDFSADELKLSGSTLAGLMRSVLDRDAGFRFKAKGHSMSPFIRDQDVLTISRSLVKKPATGDVAAVVNPATGKAIVHRIVGRTNTGAVIKGDNCRDPDGFFVDGDIIGIVASVERRGKRVWFGGGPEKKLLALLSRTRLLNTVLLPLLRKIKNSIFRPQQLSI